jgi:AraC family transcriptional regulator
MDLRSLSHTAERARELGGITVSTTLHPEGSQLAAHYHERAYFCFVTTGRFEERAGGSAHRCAAGTLVFHPPGDVHGDSFAAATRCLNLELSAGFGLTSGALRDAFARRDQRRALGLASLARRVQRELGAGDPASGLALQGLTLELAAEWMRVEPAARRPAWIDEVLRIVRAQYATSIDCRELAARVGVHPVRLSREFRRAHGTTITALVTRLRVDHAAHLLRTTRRPLAAIALDAGFADQSHLAKVFRRHLGTTCARYRAGDR